MYELIMIYCLSGQPCVEEVVAQFPQYDVGQHICQIAKPAIEKEVRSRVPSGTAVTFRCE